MTGQNPAIRVLLLEQRPDPDARIPGMLQSAGPPGFHLQQATSLGDALDCLHENSVDAVLFEIGLSRLAGANGIQRLGETFPDLPVIAILDRPDPELAATVLRVGAADHICRENLDCELWARVVVHTIERQRLLRQLETARSQIEMDSFLDPGTGLLNDKGFEYSLLREVRRSARDGTQLLALLVDVDGFERFRGPRREIGDQVLQEVARRVGEAMRDSDEIGHTGQDRFLVLLPETRIAEGLMIAERIRAAVADSPLVIDRKEIPVTVSLGVTSVPREAVSVAEVVARARSAVRRSKLMGKNRVSYSDGAAEPVVGKPLVFGTHQVRRIIKADLLKVARQSIVRFSDSRPVACELLIRGPDGPLQRPDDLFRLSFEQDVVIQLDVHSLKRCVSAAAEDADGGVFHVNVLPSTLAAANPDKLLHYLEDVPEGVSFCLEIDQQQILGDGGYLEPILGRLREAGIRYALDECGLGYACLESMVLLRPDVVKIRRKLAGGVADDPARRRSLRRLARTARALGAEVIAVGVESREDMLALQDLDVQFGQGYFFGRPRILRQPALNESLTGFWSWLCTLDAPSGAPRS